jgi:PKD repeat protein
MESTGMLQTRSTSCASGGAAFSPILLSAALIAVLGLASCGGGGGRLATGDSALSSGNPPASVRAVPAQPAQLDDAAVELPLPSTIRSSSAATDYIRSGAQFEAGGPKRGVNADIFTASFTPQAGASGKTALSTSAFAMYHYNVPDLTGEVSAYAQFSAAPGNGAYIGVANWQTDRWDWFSLAPGTQQSFGDLATYRSSSNDVYLVLMITRAPAATLTWLRVGGNQAPVANLTPNTPQTIDAGGIINFSATSSVDYDGTGALNYDWDVDGQPGYELTNAAGTLDQVYSTPGDYTATVRVYDSFGLEDTAAVQITVEMGDNLPPVADIQADAVGGGAPLAVNFDASGSSDSDGSIAKYEWDFETDGIYDLDSGTTAGAAHIYTDPGDYQATVRVTDNLGAMDTASTLIQVTTGPAGDPIAYFKPDFYFGDAPLAAIFDASYSSDDGSIVKYEWDWDNNGTFEEDKGADPNNNHSFPNPGTFPVSLRVTDDDGGSDTFTVNIIADNGTSSYDDDEPADTAQTAQALPGIGFKEWEGRVGDGDVDPEDEEDWYSFTLDAFEKVTIDMSFIDAECDIDMKLFESDGTTELDSSTGTTDTETLTYSSTDGGTYLLRVYKFTSDVLAAADYTLNGTREGGEAPVADLQSDITSGDIPLAVNFDATASYDPGGGTITNYEWDLDDDGTYEGSGAAGTTTFVYLSVGTFNAKVRVTNDLGFTSTDTVQITTQDGQGNAPTADIQGDVSSGNIALTVNFNAGGSTAPNGGSITNYEWDLDGNGVFESDSDGTSTFSATYFKAGTYNATVRVTSDLGITDTDSFTVTATGTMDEVEPNNLFSAGQSLPVMPFNGFFCDLGPGGNDGGNEDWYKFTLPGTTNVNLSMKLHDNFGDLDLKIFASDGTTEEGSSTGTDDQEDISVTLDAGTYYVKCYVYTTNTTNGPGHGGYELIATSS